MRKCAVLLTLITSILTQAQNWEQDYSMDNSVATHDRVVTILPSGNGYLLRTHSELSQTGLTTVGFIEIDLEGNVLQKSTAENEGYNIGSLLSRRTIYHDGFYYITCTENQGGPDEHGYCLVKMDESLNVVWKKNYNDEHIRFSRSMLLTQDGNIVIHGDGSVNHPDGPVNITLLKVDLNGNEIWRKTLDLSDSTISNQYGNIVELPDGDLAIGFTCSSVNLAENACIARLDLDGNLKWQNSYYSYNSVWSAPQLVFHPSGYFQMAATLDTLLSEENVYPPLFLFSVDLDGQLINETHLTGGDIKFPTLLKVLTDGSTLIGGEVRASALSLNRIGYLARVEPDGSVAWERFYMASASDDSSDFILDALETDNQLIVGGQSIYLDADSILNRKAWVFTLDKDGCFNEENCTELQNVLATDIAIPSSPFSDVSLHPNPTSNSVKIEGLQFPLFLQISNANGTVVFEDNITEAQLDLSQLKNGIYFLSFFREGEFLANRKLVLSR